MVSQRAMRRAGVGEAGAGVGETGVGLGAVTCFSLDGEADGGAERGAETGGYFPRSARAPEL